MGETLHTAVVPGVLVRRCALFYLPNCERFNLIGETIPFHLLQSEENFFSGCVVKITVM